MKSERLSVKSILQQVHYKEVTVAQKQLQSALQRHNCHHKLSVGLIKCYGTFATLTGINQLQIAT